MGEFFKKTVKHLIIDYKRGHVRRGILFIISNLFLLVALLFIAEVVLVLLGLEGVILPFQKNIFLKRLIF